MYKYEDEKPTIFTEDGQKMFLHIRDNVKRHTQTSGAVSLEKAILGCGGSTWTMIACVDRLVELGEIKEITRPGEVMGQHRVFVSIKL